MANQVSQKTKTDPKNKAIASLVLGVITIFPVAIITSLDYFFYFPISFSFIFFIFRFIFPLFSIPGLFLGILGLKSTKRKFAIAGIILCAISLLVLLVDLYRFLFG